jgi:hypothetical protein
MYHKLYAKRISNLLWARENAHSKEFKDLWSRKLSQLLKIISN